MAKTNSTPSKNSNREFNFTPRIINPLKIKNVIIFSAEEVIRQSKHVLKQCMPWLNVSILSDPVSVMNFKPDGASVFLFDDTAITFTDTQKIKQNNKDVIIELLTSNEFIQCSSPLASLEKFPYTAKADIIFAYDNVTMDPAKTIPAAVQCAEDRLNIEKYSKARRFIFLIIDDEPRWYTQFLPVLYSIIGQRADVMLTRTYEETIKFLFGVDDEAHIKPEDYKLQGRGDDVVCVITDLFFPKQQVITSEAGIQIFNLIKKYYPRIPIMIASRDVAKFNFRDIPFIMPKGKPNSLQVLRGYVHDFTGMGDFILRTETGKIVRRVRNIQELYNLLIEAEKNTENGLTLQKILNKNGDKDYFSTWFYMHSYLELADKLLPRHDKGKRLITTLKKHLKQEIKNISHTPLLINGTKIFDLEELHNLFQSINPKQIQQFSDNDTFSSWFDQKGYPELANEFRPIHGSGEELKNKLLEIIDKWINIYKL